jgi:hypothetical protein
VAYGILSGHHVVLKLGFQIAESSFPTLGFAVRSPRGLEQLERDAIKRVREECPNVYS